MGTFDAATVAEIYTSCFKEKTIVFLAGCHHLELHSADTEGCHVSHKLTLYPCPS